MSVTAENSVVSIEYEVKENGTTEVLDSNIGQTGLDFITGKGQVIIGLEEAMVGMNIGDHKEVVIPPEKAYGQKDPEGVQSLPIEQFADVELQEGMALYGQGEHGETIQVVVKSFDDNMVELDFNHPLAGKELLFSVKVLECREATAEEIAEGHAGGACESGEGSCGCGH